MNAYTVDTQSLFRYLTGQRKRLSKAALRAFDEADLGQAIIYVPAIVLCEMWMVNHAEGRRFDYGQLMREIQTAAQFVVVPLEFEDAAMFDEFVAIPNDHDRMIAIAAHRMDAPLITSDGQIIASGLVKVVR